ncbi:MAG: nuclear transport factor 2 family protein [Caldilineaceae bacterium]
MTTQSSNLETVRHYLKAIENGATGAALAEFYAPEVVQEEFPNRLVANGARRDLAAILEGAERGQKVISAQTYEVRNAVEQGNTVALEVLWTGTMAVPFGSLAVGDKMRAHFAVFIEFRDGKIVAQRNYDCFEPW